MEFRLLRIQLLKENVYINEETKGSSVPHTRES